MGIKYLDHVIDHIYEKEAIWFWKPQIESDLIYLLAPHTLQFGKQNKQAERVPFHHFHIMIQARCFKDFQIRGVGSFSVHGLITLMEVKKF